MWHRFPEDHGLHELLTQKPHIAFTVDDLDAEIEGKQILLGPYEPIPGFRVCIIEEFGEPIELIQTEMSDEEVAAADRAASQAPQTAEG